MSNKENKREQIKKRSQPFQPLKNKGKKYCITTFVTKARNIPVTCEKAN
jgi:hypothetical protein